MNPETPSDGLPMKRVPGRAYEENCREDKKREMSEQMRQCRKWMKGVVSEGPAMAWRERRVKGTKYNCSL